MKLTDMLARSCIKLESQLKQKPLHLRLVNNNWLWSFIPEPDPADPLILVLNNMSLSGTVCLNAVMAKHTVVVD